uniref:Ice-binding protein C-terminal domain-containing protein n=1 Tax=uncultured Armatimonadetes bacterium TaxID=157466 RepID=A0A6J4JT05_9BACT|nr:hypothetical protein AVDCRST_MAG63-4048 [uncultured Armatimonadetes bacterium]
MSASTSFRRAALAIPVFAALGLAVAAPGAHADEFTVTGNSSAATAQLNILSLTPTQFEFEFINTTGGSLEGTTVTGIGFDLPAFATGPFSLFAPNPNNTNFQFTTDAGNVPQFNTAELDFALITGNNFSGGNPPSGLAFNETSATYTIDGTFAGLTELDVAESVFIRFQSIPGDPGSDVGHDVTPEEPEEPGTAIPEPGTMALLGTTLVGGIGAFGRRRRA